ncbi:hypothetical protein KM472_gp074 [Cynomolgus macaque cytomegalovirus strain Ottawa]|uniref:Rh74 n=2 Tax=Cytomegalovirus TaxID=10358 RepID=Q7TFQ7_RHCM6|nr:hypothetical protein KM472_gp074 [Cynomolgus macaque cytomegalovirus strain Ottawa]YP_068168.1 rh74 [macacine betaherpesvirus 3]AAP50601.1 rh74 [macacine betaherpesvirus 3]AAZ80572.1 rh74 [macacine betaherpesvirus 3]AEQ32151.1 hypothetical protein cy71 [Cynomolgus macaque cytomegalovirus strain Ottawa]
MRRSERGICLMSAGPYLISIWKRRYAPLIPDCREAESISRHKVARSSTCFTGSGTPQKRNLPQRPWQWHFLPISSCTVFMAGMCCTREDDASGLHDVAVP